MIDLSILQSLIRSQRYEISLHAQKERLEENISLEGIEQAIFDGEIIERYPKDPRGASCLVLGSVGSKAIHVVCSVLPNGWLRIITVYIPQMPKWKNPKQRSP